MDRGTVYSIQWCDTRDMTADGHANRIIDNNLILQVMGGTQSFKHELKRHAPYLAGQTASFGAA
eukprot:4109719-Pyramimonas_sp.AAC.1